MTEKIINSYNLFLNSSQRNSGDSDDFIITFNKPINLTNSRNRFRLSIPQCVIPYSFSQINSSNNKLYYNYLDSSNNSFSSFILFNNGNYNINSLLTECIKLLCNDINFKFVPGVNVSPVNFTFTYNPSETKVQYIVNNYNFSITFLFNLNKSLGAMFGFINQMTFSNIIPAYSVNKINVAPIQIICIRSKTINTISNMEALTEKFYGPTDILATVPIMSLPNTYLFHNAIEFKTIITNAALSEISIYLSDNINTEYKLELNGVEMYLHLLIEEIEPINIDKEDNIKDKTIIHDSSSKLISEREKIINNLLTLKQKLINDNENKEE